MNKKDCFFEALYKEIKYQGIHKDIHEELSRHIDESVQSYMNNGYTEEDALSHTLEDMGKPEHIGKAFNKQYAMPFGSKHGLFLWSAASTCFIYFVLYPFLSKLNEGAANVKYTSFVILMTLTLFTLMNYLILRRGHFKINRKDIKDISAGFIAGAACSLIILFTLSLTGKYGFYPYCSDIKILFFNTVNYMGSEIRFCGDELLIWIFCTVLYLLSCKINTKPHGFTFAKCLDSVYPYPINIDENSKLNNP